MQRQKETGRRAWFPVAVLGLALLLYAGLAWDTARSTSATFDEGKHLPVGYMFLRYGDFRLDPDNPPLARMIAAAPLLATDIKVDRNDPDLLAARHWEFGHRFLYEWNDADTLLARGRMAITMLGLLLAGVIFLWTRARWGATPAALAALLCASSPDILAHGSLATTDLAVAFFFFLTIVCFESLMTRVSPWRILATGASLGCALASKHSAVTLLPVLALLGFVAVRQGRVRTRVLLQSLAVVVAIAGLTIWGVYRCRFSPSVDVAEPAPFNWNLRLGNAGAPGTVLRAARDLHLLPEAYLYGFGDMLQRGKGHPAFLFGERREGAFLWYFPATFLLKTPLPLLLLLAAGTAVMLKKGTRNSTDPFLWIPVVTYAALATSHGLDIGHRHLLPIYPFLFIIASRCASWPWAAPGAALRRAVPATGAGAQILAALLIHPHHLSYFNVLIGGPSQGYRYLVDSNLDWGQDLKGLKPWLDAHPGPKPKLSYFGTADPDYYGIAFDRLPGAVLPAPEHFELFVRRGDRLVVSVTNLQCLYLEATAQPLMALLRSRQPIGSIGYSIFVYDADFDWVADASAAAKEGWLEEAIASYTRAVHADPRFAAGYGALGEALVLAGRPSEAVFAFAEAAGIDPDYFRRHPRQAAAYDAALGRMGGGGTW